MSLHSMPGYLRQRLLCAVHRRVVPLQESGPFASFTFDDFPRTAYTVGGSILKSFGVRGTYYVAMGLMNSSNGLGDQFRAEDLHAAAADGHELASHTFSHPSSRKVPLAVFQQDVRKGYNTMRAFGSLAPSENFAYPFGDVTFAAKQALGSKMLSCRGTYGGLNGPFVDLNLLRANSLYGDLERLDAVQRLILENEERKAWLIFYTHDVRPSPSRYGCTPRFFESVVRLAADRRVRILPVAEILAEIGRQSLDSGSPD